MLKPQSLRALNRWNQIQPPLLWAATLGLLLPLILYGKLCALRPPRTPVKQTLFQGVIYERQARSTPRPLMIHQIAIDLTAPGIRVFVTPGQHEADGSETNARTTSVFLREFGLQLAINANFFRPFQEQTPWDFYPQAGDRVGAIGQAISNGHRYSLAQPPWPALCFSGHNRAQILASGICPPGTMQAVAGSHMLIDRGKLLIPKTADSDREGLHSRTAVGVNRSGDRLWILAIDDKQPLYSEGVTLAELTELMQQLGVDSALNLDGGGSTTVVISTAAGATVLNAPVHTKLPMRERPVATHLGFYALPASPVTQLTDSDNK